ncbi:hypothetical protein ETC05_10655 [Geobacillus sp. BMUD]|nr:hypothetical protein [Geobacillus sp. BMUD]
MPDTSNDRRCNDFTIPQIAVGGNWRACLNTPKGIDSLFLKKHNPEDAQMEEIDEIIDECLAKIATHLT